LKFRFRGSVSGEAVPAGGVEAVRRGWRQENGDLLRRRDPARSFRDKLLAALEGGGLVLPAAVPRQWPSRTAST